jgi:geranylgeranyl reductase family protein
VEQYDVVVVGAGPAGSSAALAARRLGASVLLLDKAAFPRDKACGDGIAPHALDVLRDLGVTGVETGYRPVPALRLIGPRGTAATRPLARPTYTIPRTVFDARLVAAAVAAGATLVRHTVRTVEVRDDCVELDGSIRAGTVVGADGAYSTVRRALGQAGNPDGTLALAIRGYAAATGDEQHIVTAPAKQWPAYAWNFPIGDGRANIGYGEVLRGDPLTRQRLLDRLGALMSTVDISGTMSLRAHHLPLSTHRPVPGRGRLLLAGDAYSLVNPITGEGIFYAVLSGSLAGASAVDGAPAEAARRYRAAVRRRLGRHLRHTRAATWLTRAAGVVEATVRAARDDQRVFDSLVELGLGDGRLTGRTLFAIARRLR